MLREYENGVYKIVIKRLIDSFANYFIHQHKKAPGYGAFISLE